MSDRSPFQAIADLTRRDILDLLREHGAMRVSDIVAHFPHISQPAVSKQLRILKECNLVRLEPRGRERWYTLNVAPLRMIYEDWLQHFEPLWSERLNTLKNLAEDDDDSDGEIK